MIIARALRTPTRLAFLVQNLELGGVQNVVVRLATALDRDEWAPEVWLLHGHGPTSHYLGALEDAGIPVHSFPKMNWNSFTRFNRGPYLYTALKMAWRRPRIVQSFCSQPYGAEPAAVWLARVPIYIVRQCSEVYLGCRCVWEMKYWLAKRIVVLTERMRRRHLQTYPHTAQKIVMIPNGVDTQVFAPRPERRGLIRREVGLGADAFVLVCVARLTDDKNQGMLIRALANLPAKAHLWLVGTGDEDSLRKLVGELQLGQRVHFFGARRDVADILNDADVFVLTSKPGWEGLPSALLEAKSAGLPAVISRAGFEEVVTEGVDGLVVEPDDTEQLIKALTGLIDQTDYRQRLGEQGRRAVVEKYSFQRTARAYADMYRELAGTHTAIAG
jgi:glycosyltransferase involved in cell wall biosynthesis